jgi:excisionase family DNA binding protein
VTRALSAEGQRGVNDRLLTDQELAEILNVPASWVGEAARQGRIPCIMLGRYRRFDRADVRDCLEELKRGGRRRGSR